MANAGMASRLTRSTEHQSMVRKAHTPPSQLAQTDAQTHVLALQQTLGNQAGSQLLQKSGSIPSGMPVDRGQPLDPLTRAQMESRFEQNFSQVQIHTDSRAAASARSMNALAYTVGQHIVFGAGQFAPETLTGQRLIAHELTHTLQQRQSSENTSIASESLYEREATQTAEAALHGAPVAVNTASPIGVARQPIPGSVDLAESASPTLARAIGSITIDNFGLGKADIPPSRQGDLRKTAQRIVTLLRRYPRSTIRVTGHTDTVGTDERNQSLGTDRATAVKAVLTGEGIPEQQIQTESKGKTSPAVPTKDDKPEGRNRRVTVQFEPVESPLRSMLPDLTLKPKPHAPIPFDPFKKQPIDLNLPKSPLPDQPKPGPWREPPQPLPPNFWKPNVPEIKGAEPKSPLDLFYEKVTDPLLKPLLKPLPKDVQKFLLEKAHDAIEKGITAGFEAILERTEIDDKTKEAIKGTVETAIKSKPGQTTDRKSDKEGSPYHKESEPPRKLEEPFDLQEKKK